jgi:hypothetical protein
MINANFQGFILTLSDFQTLTLASVFQPIQEINIHRMRIPVHHCDDGQTDTYFRRRDDHDEKNKNLSVDPGIGICNRCRRMMHFRKSNQQEVHGIQHQLDAHKNDNGIPARQYTGNTDAEQRD